MSSGEGVVMKYKASEAVWTMKGFMRHAKGFGFLPWRHWEDTEVFKLVRDRIILESSIGMDWELVQGDPLKIRSINLRQKDKSV